MDDYLTKPLVAADLARALARAGDRPEPDGTPAATGRRHGRTAPGARPGRAHHLRELVGGDPSALSGLVAEFLAEAPPLVHELRAAVAVGDPGRAHRAAHTLKGLGATFGATTMALLCQRAESDSAEPGPDMTPGGRDRRRARARHARPAPAGVAPESGRPLSCSVVA